MSNGIRRHCRALATLAPMAVTVACLAAAPARADDGISAEHAQQLEKQIHDWLAALLGPHADPGDRPLHITAESDHYRAEWPFAAPLSALTGVTIKADPVTAELKPLDGGRWAIDDIRSPSPLEASFQAPQNGSPPSTVTLRMTIAHQDQHAVLDPSLATPSHWDLKFQGYTSAMTGGADGGSRKTTIDEMAGHIVWEPTADGRLNLREDSDTHLLATNAVMPNVGVVSLSVERMRGVVRMEDVATDQVAPLLHAVLELAPLGVAAVKQAQAGDKADIEAPKLTAAQRAATRDALTALAALFGGFDEHATLENLHIASSTYSGRVAKATLGFGASAPGGRSQIRFELSLDGLDSPDIPPGVFRDYLPRHIAIAPRIGGIPSSDLHALLLRAADSNGDDPKLEDDAKALLAKGPLAVGLDDVALDFGPATVRGKGEVRVSDVDTYEGEAHFAATGLDELIQQANTVPELKQAAPVLFMLKGMGKQDGDKTVWNITYHDKKLLVNGNDMSGMVPGAKP